MRRLEWELEQGGAVQASGEGPYKTAFADAMHYAMMYGQDGSVKLYQIKGKKRTLFFAATKRPKGV